MSTAVAAAAERLKERPILFSAPMIQAILDNRKMMTRRICKPQPEYDVVKLETLTPKWSDGFWFIKACPYGQSGERLWVRETWACRTDVDWATDPEKAKHYTAYRADGEQGGPHDDMNWHDLGGRWRPAIHMPRCLSRITLEITAVRVERVQDISEDDAQAEGVWMGLDLPHPTDVESYRAGFANLWDKINGKGSWESNPWVWAISFRKVAPGASQ